jgi:hypothetical protein
MLIGMELGMDILGIVGDEIISDIPMAHLDHQHGRDHCVFGTVI